MSQNKNDKQRFNFEKFINDIEIRENNHSQNRHDDSESDNHSAREYNNRYRESWQNRIKYRRKEK